MDPLLRKRDEHHFLRCHLGIRPGPFGRSVSEPDGRELDLVRERGQFEVVSEDFDYFVFEQGESLFFVSVWGVGKLTCALRLLGGRVQIQNQEKPVGETFP